MSKKDDKKFKLTEYTLYNYSSLDVIINNLLLDIEDLQNDITIKASTFEEAIHTNDFRSSVENEVIRRDEKVNVRIKELDAERRCKSNLKRKIDGALTVLTKIELDLVKLRYFSKEKKTWIAVSSELGFDKDHCIKMRNNIIDKLSSLIYP
ncbi:hypothetical protein [Clostridium cellulovorans]|uniref:Phage transcriptional regulator, RinA family n=1 Tax=Clostridium cellulovorans (strain ATCC 35296 / DSM 3052 / OCM 3 / 743B) TaxID=573061 RepID=D9SWE7_CLOC7|nr:hypothetical protein [Clostridium cellulovorans]ADL53229.1 hypothetical protein Clocel_3553 [Clostridium cellulovorans 743B]